MLKVMANHSNDVILQFTQYTYLHGIKYTHTYNIHVVSDTELTANDQTVLSDNLQALFDVIGDDDEIDKFVDNGNIRCVISHGKRTVQFRSDDMNEYYAVTLKPTLQLAVVMQVYDGMNDDMVANITINELRTDVDYIDIWSRLHSVRVSLDY